MGRSRRTNRPITQLRQTEKYRVNQRIKAQEIRVIAEDGEQIGIKPRQEALDLAKEANLDLVEVSPNTDPPVCKIIDYGKFKYHQQKKEAEARKHRTDNPIKELKLRYCTDVGDLNTKLKHARKFLDSGCKVKFSMRFRGRERAFMRQGGEKLDQVVEQLSDVATIDSQQSRSGSQLQVLLAPSS